MGAFVGSHEFVLSKLGFRRGIELLMRGTRNNLLKALPDTRSRAPGPTGTPRREYGVDKET